MAPEQQQLFDAFLTFLEKAQGQDIQLDEALSLNYPTRGFDRHCTVFNTFHFSIKRIGAQTSGGHLNLEGENCFYQIFTRGEFTVEVSQDKAIVMHPLTDVIMRRTTIRIK